MAGIPANAGEDGFSLLELLVVLGLMVILGGLAGAPLQRIRERSAIQNARHMVTSALALTSVTGSRWGRTSYLRIDPIRDELRVVVDTGSVGSGGDTLVVRVYGLAEELGVQVSSTHSTLCFNSRGVGTVGRGCPETGGDIVLGYRGAADTLTLTSVGRIRR